MSVRTPGLALALYKQREGAPQGVLIIRTVPTLATAGALASMCSRATRRRIEACRRIESGGTMRAPRPLWLSAWVREWARRHRAFARA